MGPAPPCVFDAVADMVGANPALLRASDIDREKYAERFLNYCK